MEKYTNAAKDNNDLELIDVLCIKTGMMENNSYLVRNKDTGEGFLVDASFSGKTIADAIREQGVRLKGILLTHGHYDHIYSVEELLEEFKDDKPYVYAGEDERELLGNPRQNLFRKHRLSGEGIKADVWLKDGEVRTIAGIEVKTVFTPGHTEGGVCFYLEKHGLIFTGDTLFAGSYGRTDLPTGDEATIYRSITGKLFTLPGKTLVLPGHRDESDIEYEKRHNPILMCRPAE